MTAIGTQISADMRRKPIGGAPDVTAPDAPTSLVATPGDSTVNLTWDSNSEPDLAGYRVCRSLTSGSGYADISGLIVVGTEEYDDDTADNGTTYYYVVKAEDTSANVSAASNESSAMPLAVNSLLEFESPLYEGAELLTEGA